MKTFEKAFLLSVLVFPGSGHVLLKRYLTGFSLIIIASIASYFLIYDVINHAFEIANRINSHGVNPDLSAILELVSGSSATTKLQSINTAMVVLLVIWLIAIVDLYRIGKIQKDANVNR